MRWQYRFLLIQFHNVFSKKTSPSPFIFLHAGDVIINGKFSLYNQFYTVKIAGIFTIVNNSE